MLHSRCVYLSQGFLKLPLWKPRATLANPLLDWQALVKTMNEIRNLLLFLSSVAVIGISGCSERERVKTDDGATTEQSLTPDSAIAQITKLGGRVDVDEKNPEKPVVAVHLGRTKLNDAGLVYL